MSVITLIETLGIPSFRFETLTERDVINIQKRLKAQMRLTGEIDQQAIDQVIAIFSHNRTELTLLFQAKFRVLKSIVQYPDKYVTRKPEERFHTKNDVPADFKKFIQKNFETQLLDHVNNCFLEDYYNSLHHLLDYLPVLSMSLMDEITNKLRQKLDYATEVSNLQIDQRRDKIEYISNPYFFRCLSKVGVYQFDNEFRALCQASFLQNHRDPFNILVWFAASFFEIDDPEVQEMMQMKKNWSEELGTREVSLNPYTEKRTGAATRRTDTKKNKRASGCYWSIAILVAVIMLFVSFFKECKKDQDREEFYKNTYENREPDINPKF